MLNINPTDAVPIWKQIEEEIRRLVAMGALVTGGAVPSVRDMAKDLRVNPATVAKAYQHLTDAGLLSVKRGEGTFVSETPTPIKRAERRDVLAAAALRYASFATTMGAGPDEAIREVEEAFEQISDDGRRRKS